MQTRLEQLVKSVEEMPIEPTQSDIIAEKLYAPDVKPIVLDDIVKVLKGNLSSEKFRLEEIANMTDHLTGLGNRRKYDSVMRGYQRKIERVRHPNNCGKEQLPNLALLAIDIDDFKQLNTNLTHVGGDSAIQTIAYYLKYVVRPSDDLFRWGGEEFVALLNDCSLSDAVKRAERLREDIGKREFQYMDKKFTMNISIGVAHYGESCSDLVHLFKLADNALFHAKNTGKNRVIVCNQSGNILNFPEISFQGERSEYGLVPAD